VGFFGKAKSYATELRVYSMAVGDLNGDGNPDLAVASVGVAVLLGNGNGGFGKPRLIGPGTPSSAVAIGDLNGDGNPDLAVTHPGSPPELGSGGVSVLLGNGNGGFGKPQLFDAGALFARAIGIGDFNGDGKPDLVFIRGSAFGKPEAVSVLLGNGDGSFGPATEYSAGFEALSLAIGDLNGDGKPDLAVDSPEFTGGASTSCSAMVMGASAREITTASAATPSRLRSAISTATASPTSRSPTSAPMRSRSCSAMVTGAWCRRRTSLPATGPTRS
jgi:hypothetical protein